jgi:NAD(P)-dependent dehydrogenase (short-subunit alcohol dehydrogenase family)
MKKSVLVIGASSSIGTPLVDQLLGGGFYVIAQFRTISPDLDRLQDKYVDDLKLFQLDFESEDVVDNVTELLALCPENLFGVVHLPSVPPSMKPLYKTKIEEIYEHFDLQIKSLHYVFGRLHKKLSKSNDFRIVGINTEITGMKLPPKGLSSYVIAKAAAASYLDCLDVEYRGKGVKVNQILPGMFRSPLLSNLPEFVIESLVGRLDEDDGSSLRPDRDIVSLILYLLSPDGINVRGQKISVGG